MRLTFAQAKLELASYAPAEKLESRINKSVERVILHGKFAGSMHTLALVARYGQIVLPRWYRTIEGVRVSGRVRDIVNHWWRFLQGKSDYNDFSMNTVRDLGDGWATMYALPLAGDLRLSYDGDEVIDLEIYGTDTEGFPITMKFNGEDTVANPFAHIDRIHKEESEKPIKLDHIAADLTETPLAWMDPREDESYYRRYIDESITGTAEVAIEVLAKLRFIKFTDDEDVLPIHNISALELAMQACQYYDENDVVLANQYMNDSVALLNKELGDTNANTIPTIRFYYAGGQPNLTSHY